MQPVEAFRRTHLRVRTANALHSEVCSARHPDGSFAPWCDSKRIGLGAKINAGVFSRRSMRTLLSFPVRLRYVEHIRETMRAWAFQCGRLFCHLVRGRAMQLASLRSP